MSLWSFSITTKVYSIVLKIPSKWMIPGWDSLCNRHTDTHTFTFMHLADAFIQSDLQLHSGYTFSLVHVFPGNRTHNLSLSWRNVLPLSHTGTRTHTHTGTHTHTHTHTHTYSGTRTHTHTHTGTHTDDITTTKTTQVFELWGIWQLELIPAISRPRLWSVPRVSREILIYRWL